MIKCNFCGKVKQDGSFVIGASLEPDWCMIYGTGKMACPECYPEAMKQGEKVVDEFIGRNKTPGLDPKNKARQEKALDRRYMFSSGISTFRELINNGVFIAKYKTFEPSVRWNRTKYNRMDGEQQREYEAKMNKQKVVHNLEYAQEKGIIIECPKLVFDWAGLPDTTPK